jgi:hypothetical protein
MSQHLGVLRSASLSVCNVGMLRNAFALAFYSREKLVHQINAEDPYLLLKSKSWFLATLLMQTFTPSPNHVDKEESANQSDDDNMNPVIYVRVSVGKWQITITLFTCMSCSSLQEGHSRQNKLPHVRILARAGSVLKQIRSKVIANWTSRPVAIWESCLLCVLLFA